MGNRSVFIVGVRDYECLEGIDEFKGNKVVLLPDVCRFEDSKAYIAPFRGWFGKLLWDVLERGRDDFFVLPTIAHVGDDAQSARS